MGTQAENAAFKGAVVRGTHDIYDDDFLWGRGDLNASGDLTRDTRFEPVLCVPITMKNRVCRYTGNMICFSFHIQKMYPRPNAARPTPLPNRPPPPLADDDSGHDCTRWLANGLADIRVRQDAEW